MQQRILFSEQSTTSSSFKLTRENKIPLSDTEVQDCGKQAQGKNLVVSQAANRTQDKNINIACAKSLPTINSRHCKIRKSQLHPSYKQPRQRRKIQTSGDSNI